METNFGTSGPCLVATGTYNNLARLFKKFRQHVNPKEDAKDAKEYDALHKLIDERELEWQMEGTSSAPAAIIMLMMSRTPRLLLRRRPEGL